MGENLRTTGSFKPQQVVGSFMDFTTNKGGFLFHNKQDVIKINNQRSKEYPDMKILCLLIPLTLLEFNIIFADYIKLIVISPWSYHITNCTFIFYIKL